MSSKQITRVKRKIKAGNLKIKELESHIANLQAEIKFQRENTLQLNLTLESMEENEELPDYCFLD